MDTMGSYASGMDVENNNEQLLNRH